MRLAYSEGYDGKYLTTDSSEEKFWLFAFAHFHGNPATADSELLNMMSLNVEQGRDAHNWLFRASANQF